MNMWRNGPEEENVRLRLVHFVVLPSQTLHCTVSLVLGIRSSEDPAHLRDAHASPLILPEQLERTSHAVEVLFRDDFEHLLG